VAVLTVSRNGGLRSARREARAAAAGRAPLRYGPAWRSSAAIVVALLYGFGGIGCLLSAWFPMSPYIAVGLSQVFGTVGLVVAPLLLAFRRHVGSVTLNGALAAATVMVSILVASTGAAVGVVLTGVFYMCIALIGAYFFPSLQARAQACLTVSGFSAGTIASGVPNLVAPWFVITVAVLGAAEMVRHFVTQLRQQAALDPLTGLANRAYFRLAAERELALASRGRGRGRRRFSVALLDLDGFKAVNDTYGHVAGDTLLTELAGAWQAQLRRGDLLARYGGDEFALIMPDTGHDDAVRILERLRTAHRAPWSAGVATWEDDTSLDQLMRRADHNLYHAKDTRTR